MPELPEVETVVRGLGKLLPRQTIKTVEVLSAKSFLKATGLTEKPAAIEGLKIRSLSRRGKGIIIHLTRDYCLLIHLKMTGQLVYIEKDAKKRLNYGHPDANFLESMPSSHTRVFLRLTNGVLYFNDQRRFGYVKLTREELLDSDPFIKRLGIEPLSLEFNSKFLAGLARRRARSNIKATLLDQSGVVGVGNIYADEALFDAKVQPTRLGDSLSPTEITRLTKSVKKVIALGIKYSGTSLTHYKTGEGAQGKMQNHLKVYGRTGLPCTVCKTPIKKIRTAGRGTHYCPSCQK